MAVLTVALLAWASPALAASPVSDQYLSAPAAGEPAAPAAAAAGTPAATAGGQPAATSPGAAAAPATSAAGRARATSAKPVKVGAAGAGNGVQQPLSAQDSQLPLAVLGGLGLLLLALAFAAIGRARRPVAAP